MRAYMRETPSSPHRYSRHGVWLLNALAALALAGCGGGGGGDDPPPAPPVTNPPATNAAPTASAGPDQTVQALTAQLAGSATDDGLPTGSTITYAWTGPSGVTFDNAASATAIATFPADGSYELTLTASDGALSGTDTVAITVQSGGGGNTPPTVTAGDNQTITLPANQVQLNGSASDAEGNTLTYAWSASPAGVTFADAAAPATTATFAAPGTYVLTLTANDGTASGTGTLTVVVNPAAGEQHWPLPDTDENVPDRGWTRITPAEAGMDAAKLAEAQAYAETAGGAGMVVKGGRLVHSWAIGTVGPAPGTPVTIDTRFSAQSSTKSIGGIVFGLAYDRNLFELADAAITHLPGLGNPPGTDTPDRLGAITVQQLATHTAGFPKDGGYWALEFDPGSIWSYSDGGLNWLADLLTNVLQEDLHAVITREVWTDLGLNNGSLTNADDVLWRANEKRAQQPPVGSPAIPHRELASGMSINANAMARVGLLFLRNGMWSTRRILSEEFVQISRTTTGIDLLPINEEEDYPGATQNYGVLWWTNSACALPNVPSDAYWGWGQYDSLIVVIPSLDLVVSRIGPGRGDQPGRTFGDGDWTADYAVLAPFLDPIVAATGNTEACTPR